MSYQRRVYREDDTFWISEDRNDTTRMVTIYEESGEVLTSYPYTDAENAAADAAALEIITAPVKADIDTKLKTIDMPAMQAILDQTNAQLKDDPSQEIKDLARTVRRLIRRVENLLDAAD